jgi:hypothetical protein
MMKTGWVSLAVLASLGGGGCGSPAPQETGLHVVANWSGVSIDQLEFSVRTSDGTLLHPAERRPAAAQGALASGADAVILLAPALEGKTVRCQVTGFVAGLAVRTGEASADLPAAKLIEVQVNLGGGPAPDGGSTPDARPDAGGSTDGPGTPDAAPDAAAGGAPNGQACLAAGECKSGFCADGVCCDTACTGACQVCNRGGRLGTCSSAAAGTRDARCAAQDPMTCGLDGTCAAGGTCQRYQAGTSCGLGSCNGNILTGASSCDGNGGCLAGAPRSCVPYACDAQARACKNSCTSSADCAAPRTCSGGQCGTFRALGQGCTNGVDCVSGNCVDGVCCSSATCGVCLVCNAPGGAGSCRPATGGQPDPHGRCAIQPVGSCGLNGTCNGMGACATYPDGTSCRMARVCLAGVCR